jgi:hypothetical protein
MSIWLTQGDLENALSVATVAAIFDDANTGSLSAAGIASVISRAESQVLSYLHEYGPPPFSDQVLSDLGADPLLKDAATQYAIIYAYERDIAYTRANGKTSEERIKRAGDLMERILQARQRPPTVPDKPSNVGGVSIDGAARLYTANPGDTIAGGSNAGDF